MRAEAAAALLEARAGPQGIEALFEFSGAAPIFAGHFPAEPVVPGVLLIAAVLAAVESVEGVRPELVEVVDAKFVAPVVPDRRCAATVEIEPVGPRPRRCEARFHTDGVLAARLRLAVRGRDASVVG